MARLPDTSEWDARYRTHGALWGYFPAVSAEETWWRLRGTGARRVLVAGCGYGRHAAYFARRGFDTTGLDSSWAAIEMAHDAAVADGLDLLLTCASATRMPFPNASFDAIYDHALLPDLTREERALAVKEYARVLRPRGLLVVSALSADEELSRASGVGEPSPAAPDSVQITGLLEDFDIESLIDFAGAPAAVPGDQGWYFFRMIAYRKPDREIAGSHRNPWGTQSRRRHTGSTVVQGRA